MLHPSYTDLMKVVNKDVELKESKTDYRRRRAFGRRYRKETSFHCCRRAERR